jgi:class 3 adenylate cyclase/pimeloyl-ACP methyl ester carboxylesterase
MEPRIQYATTRDGVSIAYWDMGEGIPIVMPPPAAPFSHLGLEWEIPEWRHLHEHLLENHRLIRFDTQGAGLSDRLVPDDYTEAEQRSLEAVVDHIGLERFALYGVYYGGTTIIEYAARHPERVSHLLLWCSFASQQDVASGQPGSAALKPLMHVDWELFTETLAHQVFGWDEGEQAHRLAIYMQRSIGPELADRAWESHERRDVTALLPQLAMPALVMHRRQLPLLDVDVARRLASRLPDAKLALFDGTSLSPYIGDMPEIVRTIEEFLGSVDPAKARTSSHEHRAQAAAGFRTIMFTDMEGSTKTTQRLGDERAQEIVRAHNRIVREALRRHAGIETKHTGDGIMASFMSCSEAVECAIEIQKAAALHNEQRSDRHVSVRIGLNAGEPLMEGDDLFGTAVQIAARVCTQAEPAQILVSDVVRQLVAGKGFMFADAGEVVLRGFEEAVRLYEVRVA